MIGRSKDNDIQISHDFISRKHAKVFFKDNQWWYQDLRVEHIHYQKDPIRITKETRIEIENQVELITEDYLDFSETVLYQAADISDSHNDKRKSHRPLIAMLTTIVFLLVDKVLNLAWYPGCLVELEIFAHAFEQTVLVFRVKNLERLRQTGLLPVAPQ